MSKKTEVTPLEHAAREVVSAIQDEGIAPNYHRQQLRRLRSEWPTLYYALFHLVRATPPTEHGPYTRIEDTNNE